MFNIQKQREKIGKMVFDNLDKNYLDKRIVFYELPTGSGKTGIILKSAYELMQKYNTSVIISTSSNNLALKFLTDGKDDLKKHYDIDIKDDDMELLLGKSNFVDIEAVKFLTKSDFEDNPICQLNEKEVLDWYNDKKNRKLVSNFIEYFNIDEDNAKFITLQSTDDIDEIATIKNFPDFLTERNRIYITNHLYLITLSEVLGLNKAFKDYADVLKDVPILIDEAHEMKKLGALKYRADFSTYRLKTLYNSLYLIDSNIDKRKKDKIKLKEDIDALFKNTMVKQNVIVNRDFIDKKNASMIMKFYSKWQKKFKTIINNFGSNNPKSSFLKRYIKKEFDELAFIANVVSPERSIEINYSTKKGYLKATAAKKDIKRELRFKFWAIVGCCLLFSGTYRVEAGHTTPATNRWSMARIGLFPFENDDNEYKKDFNNRIAHNVDFHIQKWIFPKEHLQYLFVTDKELQKPRYKKNNDNPNLKKQWAKNIAAFYEYYVTVFFNNYNTLVLVGSYDDAETLAEEFSKVINPDRIFYERRDESLTILVNKYSQKALKSRGNIFIGTLTAYTGINFYGDLCHSIIMTKLPFAPFSKLEVSRYKDAAGISFRDTYEREMILTFRQGLGRANRSETDQTALFILDKKALDKKRRHILKGFLEEMGVEQSFEEQFVKPIGDYKKTITA